MRCKTNFSNTYNFKTRKLLNSNNILQKSAFSKISVHNFVKPSPSNEIPGLVWPSNPTNNFVREII